METMHEFLDTTLYHFVVNQLRKQLELAHIKEIISTTPASDLSLPINNLLKEGPKGPLNLYWHDASPTPCLSPSSLQPCLQATISFLRTATPIYAIQLIAFIDQFFHEQLQLNNYALQINFLGCQNDRINHEKRLQDFAASQYDSKKTPPPLLLNHLCEQCQTEWEALQEGLELLSVTTVLNPNLEPATSGFTKTIFAFTNNHKKNTHPFCCGGYHEMVAKEGNTQQNLACISGTINLAQLVRLLAPIKDKLPLPTAAPLQVIIPLNPKQQMLALLLAETLRAQHLCTAVFLEDESRETLVARAKKEGASYALILGDREQETKSVTIEHLMTGETVTIPQSHAAEYLQK